MGIGAGVNSSGDVSSVSTQISTGTSYERTKTLATLGNGNINITDQANSDEMERLNRDTTNLTKSLVKTSTGTSANGTLDTRLLTEDGRAQIAADAKKAKEHAQDIANGVITVVTKDKIDITNLVDTVRDNTSATKLKDYLTQTKEGQQILAGLQADPKSGEYHDAQIAANQKLQEFRGLDVQKVAYYDAKATTNEALQDKVTYTPQNDTLTMTDTQGATITKGDSAGTVLLDASGNAFNLSSKQTDTIASGHEVGEVKYLQNGNGVIFQDSYDTKEAMNDAYGAYYAQRLNEATNGGISDAPFATNTNTPSIQLGTNMANGIIIPENGVEYRKVKVTINSFAPADSFGAVPHFANDGFEGDGAKSKFGDTERTNRVNSTYELDTDKDGVIKNAWSNQSKNLATKEIDTANPTIHATYNSKTGLLNFDYEAGNPLAPSPEFLTPAIDVYGKLKIAENGNKQLVVSGAIRGDDFPAGDAWINLGPKNTKVMVGVSQINSNQGLGGMDVAWALAGNGTKPMINVNMAVNLDKNENPVSVTSSGKTYTIEQWNSYFAKLPLVEKK